MKPLYVFLLCSIILSALAIAFPDLLLSPGPLLKGHEKLNTSCLSCHEPFAGTTTARCITCHKPDEIGIRNTVGDLLPKDTARVIFHKGLAGNSCKECHTDHKGADASKAIRTFRHASLTTALRKNCSACHKDQIPDNPLHRYAKGNCSECHTTKKWRPAAFDHKQLAASDAGQCISCHKTDRPNDNLHRQSDANCAACHGTNRWKPATFNHDRYFRLEGDHRTSCRTCHTTPGDYKKYTCYNCHEHSPSNIAAEHRKEGIYRYDNCMKCHRNDSSGKRDD